MEAQAAAQAAELAASKAMSALNPLLSQSVLRVASAVCILLKISCAAGERRRLPGWRLKPQHRQRSWPPARLHLLSAQLPLPQQKLHHTHHPRLPSTPSRPALSARCACCASWRLHSSNCVRACSWRPCICKACGNSQHHLLPGTTGEPMHVCCALAGSSRVTRGQGRAGDCDCVNLDTETMAGFMLLPPGARWLYMLTHILCARRLLARHRRPQQSRRL